MKCWPSTMAMPVLLGLLVLVLAVQALPMADVGSQGANTPPTIQLSVNVDLSPETLPAVVSSSQVGMAEFSGNVSVGKLPITVQHVTVTLEAIPISGWSLILSPSVMVFTSEAPQEFFFTVQVLPKTQVTSKVVTVTATASDGVQRVSASTTVTVTVPQFFKLSIHSDEQSVDDVRAGDTVPFEFTIHNEGNGKDTVSIDILDESHALDGYDLTRTVDIPPYQNVSITVSLDTRKGFEPLNGLSPLITKKVSSVTARNQGTEYSQMYSFALNFYTFRMDLAEHWPIYVGWGVGLAVSCVILAMVVRRIRRRRRQDRETLAAFGDGESG